MKIEPKLLKQIILCAPNFIFWKDKDLVYQGCNLNFVKAIGFTHIEEVIGKTDDEMPWGQLTGNIYKEEDKQILTTGVPINNKEVPMRLSADSELMLLSVSKVPLFDDHQKIIGILGIYIDITERKKNQEALIKAENQLEGAKLVSASIAHEIRTPLATTKASVDTIKEIFDQMCYEIRSNNIKIPNISDLDFSKLEKNIRLINKKTDECNIVINMLLTKLQNVHSGVAINFENFLATSCIEQAEEQLNSPEMSNKINFNKNNDFMILGDHTMMVHVMMNLFKNAFFYIKKATKGEIFIWLEKKPLTNAIHFKDTATGISSEVLPNIFKTFFTTEQSTNTGTGLALCKIIIEAHHGKIECISEEGEYTEFILTLPKLANN